MFLFFPPMGINRSHRFVTSENVLEKKILSLSMYINIFPPISHHAVFWYWEPSIWLRSIHFLLLPFSNLEGNCCFRQHEASYTGLAILRWPDGLDASFPLLDMSAPLFTGHMPPHWSCGKGSESVDASHSFLEQAQLGYYACRSIG